MLDINHGIFKYEPKFFSDIARSNAYELIKLILIKDPPSLEMYEWSDKSLITNCEDICIIPVMKKLMSTIFAYLYVVIMRRKLSKR